MMESLPVKMIILVIINILPQVFVYVRLTDLLCTS